MINIQYPFTERAEEAAHVTAGSYPVDHTPLREGYHRHLREKFERSMQSSAPGGRPGRITMDNKQGIRLSPRFIDQPSGAASGSEPGF